MSKFFQFNLKSFFFELADKNKDQVLDGDEIEILFNRFPNRFAGFNIMSLLKKPAKDTQKNKVTFESSTFRQKIKFNLKFKGDNLNGFKEFKVLLEEIKRNKPHAHIQHANVVDRDNESILFITTNDKKSYEELSCDWPADAFKTGIFPIKSNLKYFVAIRGVSRKNKHDDKEDLINLKEEYGLINLQRIFNKEKIETTIVKAEAESETQMVNAVKHGVYINNYHHKVDLWTFSPKVCYKHTWFISFNMRCAKDLVTLIKSVK